MAMVPPGCTSWVSMAATGVRCGGVEHDGCHPAVRPALRLLAPGPPGRAARGRAPRRSPDAPVMAPPRCTSPPARRATWAMSSPTGPPPRRPRPAQQWRHPPHGVDGDRDGLRERRDIGRDGGREDVEPVLRDRDPTRQGTVAVDADQPQPGTGVRRTDLAGGTRSARQQRVDQHRLSDQPARLWHAHELVADGERQDRPVGGCRRRCGGRCHTDPREARPDDDLAGRSDRLRPIPHSNRPGSTSSSARLIGSRGRRRPG